MLNKNELNALDQEITKLQEAYRKQYEPLLARHVFEVLQFILAKKKESSIEIQTCSLDDFEDMYALDLFFESDPDSGWNINTICEELRLETCRDIDFTKLMIQDAFTVTASMTFDEFKAHLKL